MSWDVLKETELMNCGIFKVARRDTLVPHTGKEFPFYVLKARDWVVVAPITQDGHLVMVQQYRHGIQGQSLEVPAGIIEPGEEPIAAAERELLEETGYRADRLERLGTVHTNPAFLNNRCHLFAGRDTRWVSDPRPDENEAIHVRCVPLADVPGMVQRGEITHSIAIVSFYLMKLMG